MSHKYIILINSKSYQTISNKIEGLAPVWWRPFGTQEQMIYFIMLKEDIPTKDIRARVQTDDSSVYVLKVHTEKNSSACGDFTKQSTWDWIKAFDTDDIGNKSNEESILPNASVTENKDGEGL